MTHQWTPPQQPMHPPGGGGGSGGNGLVHLLIGLLAVLALVLGVVAAMAFGGGSDDGAATVADAGQLQAPPAPDRPDPTAAAPARETVTETERVRDGGRDRDSETPRGGRNIWGADAGLEYCGNGGVTGNSSTSCPFAKNVADAVWEEDIGARYLTVRAYSPTTKKTYTMNCTLGSMSGSDATYKCAGGNNAVVYVGVAG